MKTDRQSMILEIIEKEDVDSSILRFSVRYRPVARFFSSSSSPTSRSDMNPFVLSAAGTVTVAPAELNRKQVYLSVDGGKAFALRQGDKVRICRADDALPEDGAQLVRHIQPVALAGNRVAGRGRYRLPADAGHGVRQDLLRGDPRDAEIGGRNYAAAAAH